MYQMFVEDLLEDVCSQSDSDSSQSSECDILLEKLQQWEVNNHCPIIATINGILRIFNEEGYALPRDRRTLLGTMRTVPIITKAGGEYIFITVLKRQSRSNSSQNITGKKFV